MYASCPSLEGSEVLRQLSIPLLLVSAEEAGALVALANAMIAGIDYPTPENPPQRAKQLNPREVQKINGMRRSWRTWSTRVKPTHRLTLPNAGSYPIVIQGISARLRNPVPTRRMVTGARPVSADGLAAPTSMVAGNDSPQARRGIGGTANKSERPETHKKVEERQSSDIANLRRRRILVPTRVGGIEQIPAITWATVNGVDRLRAIANCCGCSNVTIGANPASYSFRSSSPRGSEADAHGSTVVGVGRRAGFSTAPNHLHTPVGMPTLSAGAIVPMHFIGPCVTNHIAMADRSRRAKSQRSMFRACGCAHQDPETPINAATVQIFERSQDQANGSRRGAWHAVCHWIRRCSHQLCSGQCSANRLPILISIGQ
jgi:hypothetical protein